MIEEAKEEQEEIKLSEEEVTEQVEAYTDTLISEVSKKEFPEDIKKELEKKGKESKFADKPFLWDFMFYNPDTHSPVSEYEKLFKDGNSKPIPVGEKELISLQNKFLIDIGEDPKQIEEQFKDLSGIQKTNAIKKAKWEPIKKRIDSIDSKLKKINKILTKEYTHKKTPLTNVDLQDITKLLFDI